MKIVFLCRSLNYGGTERQLIALSKGLSKLGHVVIVYTFYSGGQLEDELNQAKVTITALHKCGRWDVVGFMRRFINTLHEDQPQIIHGFLGMPNILSVLVKPLFPKTHVVWGVRASFMDLSHYDWLARLTYFLERLLSRFADFIIVNSHTGFEYAVAKGFPKKKLVIIPNGIDTERFCSDPQARQRIRSEWKIIGEQKLIGLVGRLDPMKDHPTFLKAAALLIRERKDVRFVCVGAGHKDYLQKLQYLEKELGLTEYLIWADSRDDMPSVYNALDIAVSSSSYGEGFSNVIGEAMACGLPCVVTNVGDSARIVGDTGVVVPPKSPEKLAEGLMLMLSRLKENGSDIKLPVRNRIISEFALEKLIQTTSEVLKKLL
jgi:glycosyltransferase involved in cell wall biosynthesis